MRLHQLAAALLLVGASASLGFGQESYTVDPVHSTVLFRIKHLNTAYAYGRFNSVAGSFTYDKNVPTKSSLELTVKTDSVDTASVDRDKHLKSPDFLNAKQFPTATFKSTSVRPGKDAKFLEVTGNLTLSGVTKEVTTQVELVGEGASPFKDYRFGVEARFRINRSDFGIQFMPQALSDDILLIVSLEGVRK